MNRISILLRKSPPKLVVAVTLLLASSGFVACAVAAFLKGDSRWIERGGAWIAAVGALLLFAEWSSERQLDERRSYIDHILQVVAAHSRSLSDASERIAVVEEAVRTAVEGTRLRIVAVSAALIFLGTILHGFGDLAGDALFAVVGR